MPALLTQKKFDFTSHSPGLGADAFSVVNFTGFEGFSTCYRFEITLVGNDPEIDITAVLEHPATFTILREEGDIPFHGILTEFEQLHAIDEYVVFRTVLSPRLWWLSLTHHNQVFLDKTAPQVLAAVLEDGGLTTDDFELRLVDEGAYEPWEFICQYGESHLDFVSRWMEREGMYYYFEQTPSHEKVIITDTAMAHGGMPEGRTMYYSPPSGLDEPFREEVIHAFICKQKLLPGKVHVQDYNYRTPSLNLTAEAEVSARGRGEFHIYGDHFRTLNEGHRLADLRSQELRSHEKRFHGESTIPFLRPGYLFDLERHYRSGFNQQYLTIELEHAGSQAAFLISGIQQTLSETEKRAYYHNTFVVIPSDVQYRHPKTTEKPRFSGTLNATVDAAGSGDYAELDSWGRYKIKLPFDLSGRKDGKASHYLRMAQPYAGENQGMHFPLHKNTEVLLTFIEGDPDRPVIAAAVPNPETPSPVTAENQVQSIIKTGKGPATRSVGASWNQETNDGNYISLTDGEEGEEGDENAIIYSSTKDSWMRLGSADNDPCLPAPPPDPLNASGIRIRSDGNIWLEARDRYGEFHVGTPNDLAEEADEGDPSTTKNMLDNFGENYNPTNLLNYVTGNAEDFLNVFDSAHVRVSSFDTFNTQEGNIYDFGGYWNYNLGNSYAEEHINQTAELNTTGNGEISIDNFTPKESGLSMGVNTIFALSKLTIMAGIVGISASAAAAESLGAKTTGVAVSSLLGVTQTIWETAISLSDEDKSLSQAPETSEGKVNLGDIVAYPNFGDIKTWAGKVGSSFVYPDPNGGDVPEKDKGQVEQLSGEAFYKNENPMNTATAWVSKNFGDSYSFTKGNSIEITNGSIESHNHGNTYEFTYGGRHEESKISGEGGQVYYSWSQGGDSYEQKWTRSGNIVSIDYNETSKADDGGAFGFSSTQTARLDVSFAIGASASISASVGAHLDISSSLGGNVNIESAAGINFDIKFGGALTCTVENDKIESNIPGLSKWDAGGRLKNVGVEKANALESIKTAAKDISNGDKKIDTFSNAVVSAMNILLG